MSPMIKKIEQFRKALLIVIIIIVTILVVWRFFRLPAQYFQALDVSFVDITDYYDDRTFACTMSWDDFFANTRNFEDMFGMLNSYDLTYTMGVITEHAEIRWSDIQDAFDWAQRNGTKANTPYLMELGSHSKDHSFPTGWDNATAYDQIWGSAMEIKGNITLDGSFWAMNRTEYVLAWIEPWGQYSAYTRKACGDYYYLTDRDTFGGLSETYWKLWDSEYGSYEVWGAYYDADRVSNLTLKNGFDWCYINRRIFNIYGHPNNAKHVWDNPKSHTADWIKYISGNTSCWYAHHGTLYSYHFIETNQSGALWIKALENNEFQITVNSTAHKLYGLSYPVTYKFNIPSACSTANVYYRHRQRGNWIKLPTKTPADFFNGIAACRFDFNNSKVYISIGFSDISDDIYLKITGKCSSANQMGPAYKCSNLVVSAVAGAFPSRAPRRGRNETSTQNKGE